MFRWLFVAIGGILPLLLGSAAIYATDPSVRNRVMLGHAAITLAAGMLWAKARKTQPVRRAPAVNRPDGLWRLEQRSVRQRYPFISRCDSRKAGCS